MSVDQQRAQVVTKSGHATARRCAVGNQQRRYEEQQSRQKVGYLAYLRRRGCTPNGHIVWSEAELESLRTTWPDAETHRAAFPHRGAMAYVKKGWKLGLRRNGKRGSQRLGAIGRWRR